jgi:hypothetical protein
MQRVGFAVWQLQELENTSATYVVLRLRQTRGVGVKRGKEIAALVEKATFGKLLRELQRAGILPNGLAGRLEGALEERNWLVHRARREYRGVLADMALYSSLSQRVDKLAEDARVLLNELGGEVESFIRSSGIDMEAVDREAQRLAASWGLTR